MFSPSDYNDAVPQFTNGNYANTPLNPLYVEEPDAVNYNRGSEPLQTLPAQWWNWLCNKITSKLNNLNIYVKNIFDELTGLLSVVGETPDATSEEVTTEQLKDMFETKYPKYLQDNFSSNISIQSSNKFFTAGGMFDYTFGSTTALSWLGKVFGRLLGRKWTQGTGGNTTYNMLYLVYANGLWVCGSISHGIWWSEDGKSWTQGTGENTTYTTQNPVYANGLWVCCSSQHGMWWSEDGKSWTQGTGGNTTYRMQYLVYANGLWVCGSISHGIWWSEDGKSWTQGTGASTTYTTRYPVYVNGLWVCGSNYGMWYSSVEDLIAEGAIV